jgi:hypothetical protein
MKTLVKAIILILVLSAILMPIWHSPIVESETSSIIDQSYEYIMNVLPIETEHYNTTFKSNSTLSPPWEYVGYTMESTGSTLSVSCDFYNKTFYSALVSARTGSIVYDKSYSTIVDIAREILQRHQIFTSYDSTEMISLLSIVKKIPTSVTLGDFVLEISHLPNPTNTSTYDSDIFRWAYTKNDTYITNFDMYFVNGNFNALDEYRSTYSTGSTSVNITKEQAISTAVNYIGNYSYTATNGTKVSGFNVSENQAAANLLITVKNGNVLYPCWNVVFNLTQTYPDQVNQLFAKLWADTGEIFASGNLSPNQYSNPSPTPTPTSSNPSPSTTSNPSASPTPLASPTQTPSSSPSPSTSHYPSPTQQPTPEPTQTASPISERNNGLNTLSIVIGMIIIVALAAASALAYSRRRRSKT